MTASCAIGVQGNPSVKQVAQLTGAVLSPNDRGATRPRSLRRDRDASRPDPILSASYGPPFSARNPSAPMRAKSSPRHSAR